ncbi:hypothetical protein A1O1_05365 [Capronia coronata CBS 617.96]|uniref:Uncharacterized protein n=1 Tax=Capronia coronata CBS 617.96 TaxID=1182541 RepID=W9YFK6_9EURO|nr:uncharacterized protein A1O1_05365 [Capronia coronata CBS 617.96]EXJ88435.1 hypothetical protein A1O1_05365 [Capronia coronata CBS 617.96]
MSQAAPNTPSVVVNGTNNKQQVPLRDYLNARVAPFLKKAITESLGVEAEFPLQWLGECLIHQSILYEGNPDRTNIRERFLYKFEAPAPHQETTQPTAPSEPQETQQDKPESERPQVVVDEPIQPALEPVATSEVPVPETPSGQDMPATNGMKQEEKKEEQNTPRDDDTEMGGIS